MESLKADKKPWTFVISVVIIDFTEIKFKKKTQEKKITQRIQSMRQSDDNNKPLPSGQKPFPMPLPFQIHSLFYPRNC